MLNPLVVGAAAVCSMAVRNVWKLQYTTGIASLRAIN